MISAMEDKFAIEELVARYNQSLDQGRYEEFLACWCEDGVFDGLGGHYAGLAAIRKFTDGYDTGYRLRLNGLKHFTVNILSRIDGDQASSSSHLQLVCTGTKGARILFTGLYEDKLRRVEGEWRFSHRTLLQDMPLESA
ncbi:nuclear transport factor 2 family protein [Comamonadaceae bacterium G21597-S1]|nr:nuclear transport factor 2 family protein [Comamonadaceae bacterium G21597-S1]